EVCEHGLQLGPLGLREEAHLAQVDPQQRHVDLDHGPGRAQERAVAAQDDEDVRRWQLVAEALEVRRLGRPLGDSTHLAPAPGSLAELDGGLARGVVGEADPADRHGAVTAAIRAARSAHSTPWWNEARNSRLPSGPRMGEAISACAPRPIPRA